MRPLVLESEGSVWEERAAEVAKAVARIAAGRSSCRVLDLQPAFAAAAQDGGGPFTTDGVHLTDAGAEVVARAFAAVIAEPAEASGGRRGVHVKRLHRITVTVVVLEALGAAYSFALLPRLRRWGATAEEVSRPLPATLVPTRCTRRRTPSRCARPPRRSGRGSSRWPEPRRLLHLRRTREPAGLNVRSADRVHPEWQDLRAGEDYLTLDPDETMKMAVAVIEPPRAFVVRSGAPGEPAQEAGSLFRGEMAWTWGFYLEPAGASRDPARHPLSRLLAAHGPRGVRPGARSRTGPLLHGRGHAAWHPRSGREGRVGEP